MASWDVTDLVKEISDLCLIQSKRNGSDLVAAMVAGLKARVEAVHILTPSAFVQLMDATEKSDLPDAVKEELHKAFESKTAAGVQGHLKLQTSPQSVTSVDNFLSTSEWNRLQHMTTMEACQVVVGRMQLCGLKSLKEDSKKYVTALLVHLQMKHGKPLPPSAEMYKLSQYVHESFTACSAESLVGGYSRYPSNPFDRGTMFVNACLSGRQTRHCPKQGHLVHLPLVVEVVGLVVVALRCSYSTS